MVKIENAHNRETEQEGMSNESQSRAISVKLELKGINAKDWIAFWAIPRMTEDQKIEFLSAMVNGGLKQILYDNPKLIMDYCCPCEPSE